MEAGRLDRRISIIGKFPTGEFDDWNNPIMADDGSVRVWAQKTDISDAERVRAQQVGATVTTRFLIRYSSQVRNVDPTYRVEFEDRTYDISAVKEVGFREGLEITATARAEKEQP